MHPMADDQGTQGRHSALIEQGWALSQDEHFCADMEDKPLGSGHRERVLLFFAGGTREMRPISGSRC